MSSTYTGNPANNPSSITIPSDGDGPIKASDVNAGFEGLADKIAYANAHKVDAVNGTAFGLRLMQGAEFFAPGTVAIDSGVAFNFASGSTLAALGTLNESSALILESLPLRPAIAPVMTIDPSTPVRHVLLLDPGALVPNVVIKSTSTARALQAGVVCRLQMAPGLADGLKFAIKREGGTVIAELRGYTVTEGGVDQQGCTSLEIYWDGSQWRGLAAYGYVVAGAGW